jgi:Trypsin-co-occurring domain 1
MPVRVEKLQFDNGQQVLIEAYEVSGEVRRVGVADKAAQTFDKAWDSVVPVFQSLSKKMVDLGPVETQIRFGIKVGTDITAIVASAKGEANFEVTLTWKPKSDAARRE